MRRPLLGFAVCALLAAGLAPGTNAGVEFEGNPTWHTAGDVDHYDVAFGDIDGDGDLDLAAYAEDHVRLYRNTAGALETSPSWSSSEAPSGSGSVAWADADGDADRDLFTSLGLYVNTGGSLATTATFAPLAASDAFAVGDVNGDAATDVVVGTSRRLDLYLNAGGTIDATSDWNTTEDNIPDTIVFGDVDRDGFPEVAVGSGPFASRPVRVYDNVAGTLQSASSWSSSETDIVNCVAFGDLGGDGYPELLALTGNFGGEIPNRMYGNTAGTLSASATWSSARPTDGQDGAFADLDRDGDLDLVIASAPMIDLSTFEYINGTELAYWNEGGTIDPAHDWTSVPQDVTYGIAVGDVDGDGRPDLVAANVGDLMGSNPGQAVLYRNLGPNQAPAISDLSAAPSGPRVNEEVAITAIASDPEGDDLSYDFTFDAGTKVSQAANVLRWKAPAEAGTYGITVNVTDTHGGSDEQTLNVTVAAAPPKDESFFSLGNPLLWLLIVVIVVAAGGSAAFVLHRRKAAAAPGPAATAGGLPPLPPPPPEPGAPGDRVAGIRDAYRKGYLPRGVYAENLSRALGVPESPQRDALVRAFKDGRIDEGTLEENLRRLAAK